MSDEQTNTPDTGVNETDAPEQTESATTKKTTRKTSKKKASTKKTAKKAAKKTAAKKTSAKKASKKKAAKKSAKKAASEDAGDEVAEEPVEESVDETAEDSADVADAEAGDETGEEAAKPSRSRKKSSRSGGRSRRSEAINTEGAPKQTGKKPFTRLAVNYVPGEECRVALVEDGLLQEYEAERFDAISRVGNIYLGRVKNIEPGIQAAFVDFGVEEAGFLHVSDLHPSLFGGGEKDSTERVGKKTPRRERPPIEKALKKGQQILVQVLKDGVGTKGPALTSYLSIPGRFLVMMPQMDKVGVSRKVDDDELRREMRQTLDQLELPDGFGFILRTAGLGRTKTELKLDLAYLQRLWKDLERRKKGNAPRLLYSESDLLVRTLRDRVTADVDEVVIDSARALERAAEFMKIVAPRSAAKVKRYTGPAPLFEALSVEDQIASMHAREVPLPSGGRLVIDQTEALVAIDVNSGRMRSRDNETNALRCNLEAADEICRQLRLRDLGGLVINDLIDMRHARHRHEVEQRFAENLRRDKSKSTILPISEFGIMEMTRQRQSASHESKHFTECPTCAGRGLVQRPSSVADDALRLVESALSHEKVHKAELVVSSRVASELLSSRRIGLGRVERQTGKHVAVRVSDGLRIDQVRVYAYDQHGSDIELDRLGKGAKPELHIVDWEPDDHGDWAADIEEEREDLLAEAVKEPEIEKIETPGLTESPEEGKKKRRRRRGRGRRRDGEGEQGEQGEHQNGDAQGGSGEDAEDDDESAHEGEAHEPASGEGHAEGEGQFKKKRRRRRGRRRKNGEGEGEHHPEHQAEHQAEHPADDEEHHDDEHEHGDAEQVEHAADENGEQPRKKRRRRRGRRGGGGSGENADRNPERNSERNPERNSERPQGEAPRSAAPPAPDGRSTYTGKDGRTPDAPKPAASPEVTVKKPRSLYRGSRRKLAPSEIPQIGMED